MRVQGTCQRCAIIEGNRSKEASNVYCRRMAIYKMSLGINDDKRLGKYTAGWKFMTRARHDVPPGTSTTCRKLNGIG